MERTRKIISYYNRESSRYEKLQFGDPISKKLKEDEIRKVLVALALRKRETVLDAGCGSGIYMDLMNRYGCEVVGVDISDKMIERVQSKGYESVVGDLEFVHMDRKFDKILCAGVLEFCENQERVLSNLRNHMTQEGLMVLLISRKSLLGCIYYLYHLIRGIKAKTKLLSFPEVVKLLKTCGLRIERCEKTHLCYVVVARCG